VIVAVPAPTSHEFISDSRQITLLYGVGGADNKKGEKEERRGKRKKKGRKRKEERKEENRLANAIE
jgi:hypothetical protein